MIVYAENNAYNTDILKGVNIMYIHGLQGWPNFHWNKEKVLEKLVPIRHQQGLLLGKMSSLGFELRSEAMLYTITEDVIKSSEIEGEILDKSLVRSSIARRLGMDVAGLERIDRNVEGIVEMMLDATQHYHEPLTTERLFAWHASLFPTGRSGLSKITVGEWRKGPMLVVSGYHGRDRVHFEVPQPERVAYEMALFLEWLNNESSLDPILKAALAHL